ncbi:phage tail protein [Pseudomonas sp. TMP9]|uniref:phage tail protein n=1 Tax=Pseudomonas sp. TMP9 TaxID=3133144 RepID=UPI0030D3EF1F
MTDLTETTQWAPGIYQLETSDPVLAGPEGIDNLQAKQLANRTAWLKQQVESAQAGMIVHASAPDPHKQYRLRGVFTSLSSNTTLTAAHEGVIVLDATAGDRTLTLPVNDAAFGVRDLLIRRTDNSGNRAKVQASGADKIKFHTHLNAAGYSFLYLMGAGDWWHLRSDGAGGWWLIGRHDSTPLGRLSFETSTAIQPGGYALPHGVLLVRAEWPWVWDHAQASGMLVDDAGRAGFEGCWTRGDGATTVRSPDVRAEFLRALDEGRGIDASRIAGSYQKGSLVAVDVNAPAPFSPGSNIADAAASRMRLGVDAATLSDYTGASISGSNPDVIYPLSGGAEAVSGVSRSRNLAPPGRIKLI